MALQSLLAEGQRVDIIIGNHKGKVGEVKSLTAKMATVRLDDGDEVRVYQNSLQAKAVAATLPFGRRSEAAEAAEPLKFKVGDRVSIERGSYQGEVGTIEKWNRCKASVRLDGSGKLVPLDHQLLVPASGNASVATTAGANGDLDDLEEEEEKGQGWQSSVFSILSSMVEKITLRGRNAKQPDCFLTHHFKNRTLCMQEPLDSKGRQQLGPSLEPMEGHLEVISVKVEKDGYEFWGGQKQCVRSAYVAEKGGKSLEEEFEEIANFAALKTPRKVASRLQLLQSPGTIVEGFSPADFEPIPEPLSKASGGCGFIGPALLQRLTGHVTPKWRREGTSSVQVRVVAPQLGVLKGVLTLKEDIETVQYPASMLKVPPSEISSADWVVVVVTKAFPSEPCGKIGKMLTTTSLPKSFVQKKLSPMVERVLKSLELPLQQLQRYKKEDFRQESFVVGVADPTGALPQGQIFVSGLDARYLPTCQGHHQVLVTRCPCVRADDGKRLQVVTQRPPRMAEEAWQSLQRRPFGELIFSQGDAHMALPELIAEGDLDGDLYWVCWDSGIVTGAKTCPPELPPAAAASADGSRTQLGPGWLKRAQQHMLSPAVLKEGQLIGRLYRAAEKRAERDGLMDPDAQALFRAYVQSIDTGKHGNDIEIPQHLRKEVGL